MIKKYKDTHYWISDTGKVYYEDCNVLDKMTLYLSNSGYWCVKLTIHNQRVTCYVHRLVAESFILNPNQLEHVNHKDLDKLNNDVSNLEWIDSYGNIQHYLNYQNKPKPSAYYELLNTQDLIIWNQYHIFKNGVIYNESWHRFLKPTLKDNGYTFFTLRFDSNRKHHIILFQHIITNEWINLTRILEKKVNKHV